MKIINIEKPFSWKDLEQLVLKESPAEIVIHPADWFELMAEAAQEKDALSESAFRPGPEVKAFKIVPIGRMIFLYDEVPCIGLTRSPPEPEISFFDKPGEFPFRAITLWV